MSLGSTTVSIDEEHRAAALQAMIDLGFVFEPSNDSVVTVLDTFDGRLRRAGVQLSLREAYTSELELALPGLASMRCATPCAPALAAEIDDASTRQAVAELVGVRPLLRRLRFTALTSRAVARSDEGLASAELVWSSQLVFEHVGDQRSMDSIIELRAFAGSPKTARRAVKALTRLGLESSSGNTADAISQHLCIELGDSANPANVPLDPEAPAAVGVSHVLANLASSIEANWQGTIDDGDTDFLHALRVAARRTRSIITQTKTALPTDMAGKASQKFSWLSDVSSAARDLDVYLLEWDAYTRPLGNDVVEVLEPLRALLSQRRAAAHVLLTEALASPTASKLITKWSGTIARIPVHPRPGPDAHHPLGGFVQQRIIDAQTVLLDKGRLIGPDTPAEEVHDLRKDAKRLRYLLECFATILADRPRKKFVKRLKALQDNLGTHQDAEVHVALLRQIADELAVEPVSVDTTSALEQLIERLDQVRLAARLEFAERFAAYDTDATLTMFEDMLDPLET